MLRLTRLLALGTTFVCIALPGVRSQSTAEANLPLPENYFPALKEILRTAVKQSPRMVARNADSAAAEGNRIVLRAGQLPSLGGFAQYYPWDWQDRSDISKTTTVTRLNYNLTFTQPIYHWKALQNNTRIGELQLKMAQGQTAEGYRMLVQEIRSQYLALVIKKAALGRTHLARQMADDNFTVSQNKLEKKVISEADMFKPTLSRDQAILTEERMADDFASTKLVFAKLCGMPVLSDDDIHNEIPDVSAPAPALEPILTAFTSQKDPDTYSLRSLSNQIEVEKLTYANINTRLRPMLNLAAGTSQDQQSYTSNIAQKYAVTDYFVGLQVSWSIFDGFATSGAKASSLARRRQLELNYQTLSADLTDQARNQLKQVGFTRRAMELSNRMLTSSTGALRDKKADAARGLASETD
ncbi:MAG: TolC family protein, partial [Opitutaceae bacterium]